MVVCVVEEKFLLCGEKLSLRSFVTSARIGWQLNSLPTGGERQAVLWQGGVYAICITNKPLPPPPVGRESHWANALNVSLFTAWRNLLRLAYPAYKISPCTSFEMTIVNLLQFKLLSQQFI